jgi:hypothetical protein
MQYLHHVPTTTQIKNNINGLAQQHSHATESTDASVVQRGYKRGGAQIQAQL